MVWIRIEHLAKPLIAACGSSWQEWVYNCMVLWLSHVYYVGYNQQYLLVANGWKKFDSTSVTTVHPGI